MVRVLCFALLLSASLFAQNKQSDKPPEKQPEVHLNHAFIVPDAETYEAIRNSDFVKQFAVCEERTTHRKDITYTGFYLYGRHTYFEFLKPDERTPVGTSKIAFGVDRTGDLELLRKRAEVAGIKTEVKTITRAFNGKDVDWFRALDKKDQDAPSLGIWTLEYMPTFLSHWNPVPNAKHSVRREDVLARYADVVKQKPLSKVMLDVTEIWASFSPSGLQQSLKECDALGFRTEKSSPRETTCIASDGFKLHLRIADADHKGIWLIKFSLMRPITDSTFDTFGNTMLIVGRGEASWTMRLMTVRE